MLARLKRWELTFWGKKLRYHWSECGGVWLSEGQEVTEQTALHQGQPITPAPLHTVEAAEPRFSEIDAFALLSCTNFELTLVLHLYNTAFFFFWIFKGLFTTSLTHPIQHTFIGYYYSSSVSNIHEQTHNPVCILSNSRFGFLSTRHQAAWRHQGYSASKRIVFRPYTQVRWPICT